MRGGSEKERSAAALEGLLDLFVMGEGRFRFEPRAPLPEGLDKDSLAGLPNRDNQPGNNAIVDGLAREAP